MALDEAKGWWSVIIGILIIVLGLIPFLNKFNVIGFNLPTFLQNAIGAFGIYIVAAVGIYLLIDGFMEDDTIKAITLIVAALLVIAGVMSALFQFGVIGFAIPFLTYTVFNVIFVIEGILLIIAGAAMD
jgi:hypothetical protein